MKQQIKAVLDDERGVSPVIGVILMVAITVILAAVIGTFVLGLGDSLEQAPQATLDAELNSDGSISISHNGGDSIAVGDLEIAFNGGTPSAIEGATDLSSGNDFSVGSTATTSATTYSSGDTVTIIHEPSESILLEAEV